MWKRRIALAAVAIGILVSMTGCTANRSATADATERTANAVEAILKSCTGK